MPCVRGDLVCLSSTSPLGVSCTVRLCKRSSHVVGRDSELVVGFASTVGRVRTRLRLSSMVLVETLGKYLC